MSRSTLRGGQLPKLGTRRRIKHRGISARDMARLGSCIYPAGCISIGRMTIRCGLTPILARRRAYSISERRHNRKPRIGKDTRWRAGETMSRLRDESLVEDLWGKVDRNMRPT